MIIKKGSAIYLADHSLLTGKLMGLLRDSEGKRQGWKHKALNDQDTLDRMEWQHIVGATGELAFSKMTALRWSESYNADPHDPDVFPDWQVRTRTVHGGALPIRDRDLPHQRFVLMYVGSDPSLYFFCGWIWGGMGMQEKWRCDPGNRGSSCFMVPQTELNDLDL